MNHRPSNGHTRSKAFSDSSLLPPESREVGSAWLLRVGNPGSRTWGAPRFSTTAQGTVAGTANAHRQLECGSAIKGLCSISGHGHSESMSRNPPEGNRGRDDSPKDVHPSIIYNTDNWK